MTNIKSFLQVKKGNTGAPPKQTAPLKEIRKRKRGSEEQLTKEPLVKKEPAFKKYAHLVSPKKEPAYKRYQHLLENQENIYDPKEKISPPPTPSASKSFKTVEAPVGIIPKSRTLLLQDSSLPHDLMALEKIFHGLESCIMFLRGRDMPFIFQKSKKAVENFCGRTVELSHIRQLEHIYPGIYKITPTTTLDNGRRVNTYCLEFPETETSPSDMLSEAIWLSQELVRRRKAFHQVLVEFSKKETMECPLAHLPAHPTMKQAEEKKPEPAAPNVPEEAPKSSDKMKSLLERIREKEKKRAETQDQRSTLNVQSRDELLKLSRCSEIIVAINTLFTSKRKSVLPFNDVVDHVKMSIKTVLSHVETRDHVQYLVQTVPQWLTLAQTDKLLLKLTSGVKLTQVIQEIHQKKQELLKL